MVLTFMDAIVAWSRAIDKSNFTDFEVLLEEEFEWYSTNSGRATSRSDTMRFVRETELRIGNFKTLHNGEGVICGTHEVYEPGKDDTVVMCVAKLSEDGTRLKDWTITRANYYTNQDSPTAHNGLGFFL
ncbi:MAG: hypothetical protein QF839_03615 [Candidatus Poseidoniaceae archaeon]|jgi:hypothetical protein|nr:hypothetical protein [Candidatus Poseidoniaceae archaeon]